MLSVIVALRRGWCRPLVGGVVGRGRPGLWLAAQSIGDDYPAHLHDLVRFGLASPRLKVEDLRHAVARENVVATPDALDEAQMTQQTAEVLEADVVVGG